MPGFFSPSTVDFYVGLGIVVTANPYTHVYGVALYPGNDNAPLIPSISVGALGNTVFGVQLYSTYSVGDIVFFCYQQNYTANRVTPIGYILGSAPLNTTFTDTPEEIVQASQWDGENLTNDNFPLFSWMDTAKNLADGTPLQITGHGASDMLQGDVEAAGRLVSLLIGDYFAGFRANCAELLVSGLDRRLILHSFLKTESTVNSLKDTAIYNRSTITTEKTTGNVDDAWYDCVSEDKTDILPIGESAEPVYRSITQSGDILYGTHHTVFSADGEIPLYSEYEGLDGTKSLYSAVRFSIGKKPGIKAIQYIGERLNSGDQSKFDPTPEIIGDPLQKLSTPEEDWIVSKDAALFALNGYPEEFLDTTLGEYPDKKPEEIPDPLRKGEKLKIYPGIGNIDFLEDGSVRIRDAWGSYILLTHGNIELHAMNNMFLVSARDTIEIAGGNRTEYAENDVSIQARTGDIRALGGRNIRLQSGDQDKKGETIIESKNRIQLMSNAVSLDALYVGVICRDPWQNTDDSPGTFQVLANQGQINMFGNTVRINGNRSELTSINAALVLDNTATICGDVTVMGGIHCSDKDIVLDVFTDSGVVESKTFSSGVEKDIINDAGGLHVNGGIRGARGLTVVGQIVGEGLLVFTPQEKPITAANSAAVISNLQKFKPASTPEILPALRLKKDKTGAAKLSRRDTAQQSFSFGPGSMACTYRLTTVLPRSGNNKDNTGYLDNRNNLQYIYPGTAFWKTNGVLTVGDSPTYRGFDKLPKAQPNNRKD